ncbi:MAG: hypothetical protein ACOC8F_00305 [Planctomycetota bacterium]
MYHFLGAADRIGIWYRPGGHNHGQADWQVFLDFMEQHVCGREAPKARRYDVNPFGDLPPAFSWTAPPTPDDAADAR